MSKKSVSKKKERQKKLAKRKHQSGSVVNYKNISTHIRTGKLAAKGTITGNLAMDLLEETEEQRITEKNIQTLMDDWHETVECFKQGTTDREQHSRFSENLFLMKQLLEIASNECVPTDPEKEMEFRIHLSLMRDNLEKMEKIVIEFYNKIVNGVDKLYFVNSLEFNQYKIVEEFSNTLPSLLRYVDIGQFQKGCRTTMVKLSDKHYSGENVKYYRFREGHVLLRERRKREAELKALEEKQ